MSWHDSIAHRGPYLGLVVWLAREQEIYVILTTIRSISAFMRNFAVVPGVSGTRLFGVGGGGVWDFAGEAVVTETGGGSLFSRGERIAAESIGTEDSLP